jgi:5'-3' exonuclease
MGIPSYYKRLLDVVTGLVSKHHPGSIQWLLMDFNCLIYHVLRRPDMPSYYGYESNDDWEDIFIEHIIKYVNNIVKEVKPEMGVYIAIDGVVPMAKMRQQRLRRFKSVWTAEHDITSTGGERWDTNAITPGTKFMDKLASALDKHFVSSKKGGLQWTMHSSNHPGEGEHKIMDMWRAGEYEGSCAIYGLDADLIVLGLLNGEGRNVWLFREEIEMGEIVYNNENEESYTWLNIQILRDYLKTQIGGHSITEYCFAMSFLGNDFLPSSLSFKMREDGHERLLEILRELKISLLDESHEISHSGLTALMQEFSDVETERVYEFIRKKHGRSKMYSELSVGDNNWPLSEMEELVLMNENVTKLKKHWKTIYRQQWLGDGPIEVYTKTYIYGIHWVWSYYRGKMENVCFNWCYSWSMPPLWSWIFEELVSETYSDSEFPGTIMIKKEDILPSEQLCLVLPLESWGLIRSARERKLFDKAPWLFPRKFGFGSVGKRYFWECEAEIPVPTIIDVKTILS